MNRERKNIIGRIITYAKSSWWEGAQLIKELKEVYDGGSREEFKEGRVREDLERWIQFILFTILGHFIPLSWGSLMKSHPFKRNGKPLKGFKQEVEIIWADPHFKNILLL